MILTKNFNKSEFECKCGCVMPSEVLANIKLVAINLQILRDYVDAPITVNSAYRCPNYNDNVIKGAKNSQHKLGKASDIVVHGYTPDEVFDIVQNLRRNPMVKGVIFQGLGRYNTFTHLDIRENYTTWDNRK